MSYLARRAWLELRHLAIVAGYWVRPYDMTRDRRLWRWQERGCMGLWREP